MRRALHSSMRPTAVGQGGATSVLPAMQTPALLYPARTLRVGLAEHGRCPMFRATSSASNVGRECPSLVSQ
jgi:hypothetical protein